MAITCHYVATGAKNFNIKEIYLFLDVNKQLIKIEILTLNTINKSLCTLNTIN